MSETSLSLEEAVAGIDLIETDLQNEVIPYDTAGGLEHDHDPTIYEEAMNLADDEPEQTATTDDQKALITIDDKPLTLEDLANGYVEGLNLQSAVRDMHGRYDSIVDAANDVAFGAVALAEYLGTLIVPMPNPTLAYSNPHEHARQEAIHTEGVNTLARVVEHAQVSRQQAARINLERHARIVHLENAKLIEAFPQCADPAGREQFFDQMREVAYECDFSEAELRQVVDHRIFKLAHLAAQAMARQPEQKPRKRRPQRRTSNAMQNLMANGTLDAAMSVDFD